MSLFVAASALLSTSYMLPTGPAVAQVRTNVVMVTEAQAKAQWLAKNAAPAWGKKPAWGGKADALATRDPAPLAARFVPPSSAPKSGWSLTLAGGNLSPDMLEKAKAKAAKSYAGPDDSSGTPDDMKRYGKGW